jgi:hypothetical protein
MFIVLLFVSQLNCSDKSMFFKDGDAYHAVHSVVIFMGALVFRTAVTLPRAHRHLYECVSVQSCFHSNHSTQSFVQVCVSVRNCCQTNQSTQSLVQVCVSVRNCCHTTQSTYIYTSVLVFRAAFTVTIAHRHLLKGE